MSMKVTKVDGSVDENTGLKYTVGDKIILKSEEAQLKRSPE